MYGTAWITQMIVEFIVKAFLLDNTYPSTRMSVNAFYTYLKHVAVSVLPTALVDGSEGASPRDSCSPLRPGGLKYLWHKT